MVKSAVKKQPENTSRNRELAIAKTLVKIGMPRNPFGDFYYRFLQASWSSLMLMLSLIYLVINVIFAELYLLNGNCIENARPGSFEDAFFFSVQTLATIGYGKMLPQGTVGNILMTVEAFAGIVGVAIITGLIFAKFSRPTSRVIFSRVAVVSNRDGVPSLMFRMTNERTNRIVEATVRVVLAINETTKEGESVRRLYDLPLSRSQTALFALSWTAISPITNSSALHGHTSESLKKQGGELVITFMGLDETLAQTVHARHYYGAEHLAFGSRFVDIIETLPDGRRSFDYRHFHDVVPLEPKDDPR